MSIFARTKPKRRTAAIVGCFAAATISGAANAGSMVGWILADQPTTGETPSPAYSYNSVYAASGLSGGVTKTRIRYGFYEVDFAAMNSSLPGNVQVSAYDTNGYCTTSGWTNDNVGAVLRAFVACYSAGGASADTAFALLYQARGGTIGNAKKGIAFLLADQPESGPYTANPAYSYNSTGGTNTVVHNGAGDYTVTLTGFAKAGGDVQVSAYDAFDSDTNPARCKAYGWSNDGSKTSVNVLCFGPEGRRGNDSFSLAYSLGEPPGFASSATADAAYELASQPTNTNPYTPPSAYGLNSFGTGPMTSQQTATGQYAATVPGTLNYNSSIALVGAYGSNAIWCNPVQWLPVRVACFSKGGHPANSKFDVMFQTAH